MGLKSLASAAEIEGAGEEETGTGLGAAPGAVVVDLESILLARESFRMA